jgi:hypothetical protein
MRNFYAHRPKTDIGYGAISDKKKRGNAIAPSLGYGVGHTNYYDYLQNAEGFARMQREMEEGGGLGSSQSEGAFQTAAKPVAHYDDYTTSNAKSSPAAANTLRPSSASHNELRPPTTAAARARATSKRPSSAAPTLMGVHGRGVGSPNSMLAKTTLSIPGSNPTVTQPGIRQRASTATVREIRNLREPTPVARAAWQVDDTAEY